MNGLTKIKFSANGEFSKSRLKRILDVGQDLLDDYYCGHKASFLKSYPKGAFPINELQYLQRNKVLVFSFSNGFDRQVALLVNRYDPENINLTVTIVPTTLKEILIVLLNRIKGDQASEPANNIIPARKLTGSFVYELEFTKNNQILINDFLLSEPRVEENITTLRYCMKNPGKEVFRENIEKETGVKISKKFSTIVSNYGFTKAMKEAFFPRITNQYLIFKNPVTLSSALKFPKILKSS